jgi:hypothetical protein
MLLTRVHSTRPPAPAYPNPASHLPARLGDPVLHDPSPSRSSPIHVLRGVRVVCWKISFPIDNPLASLDACQILLEDAASSSQPSSPLTCPLNPAARIACTACTACIRRPAPPVLPLACTCCLSTQPSRARPTSACPLPRHYFITYTALLRLPVSPFACPAAPRPSHF